jgi:diguanylate cyclase (GGDEF)-like protein
MSDIITKEGRSYKIFLISVSLTIALFLAGLFLGAVVRNRNMIHDEIRNRAKVLFNSIVLTRKWNARYGGVFVEKRKGVESNPYLKNPDIETVDGIIYTKKNPAVMTREISEYASEEDQFSFHITSLKLLNPNNEPDEFEKKALRSFESGEEEASLIVTTNNKAYYRYMAPLYVDESCLECHSEQGYKTGDIRGGISVTFDIGDIQGRLLKNSYMLIILGIVSTLILLGIVFFFTKRLVRHLSAARRKIEIMAVTDGLTGIFDRRYVISKFGVEFDRAKRLNRNLGCILIDIDYFKKINDTYGHLAGDKVLKAATLLIGETIRTYDVLGRYGGEEFLIILPEANFETASILAERIRKHLRQNETIISYLSKDAVFSISLGVAEMRADDKNIEDLLNRADKGLYKAKGDGRDRVGWV